MNKNESYRLIAKFMGIDPSRLVDEMPVNKDGQYCQGNGDLDKDGNVCHAIKVDHLQYSSSFNHLMPVVEKITALGYDYSYYNGRACFTDNDLFDVKEAYIPADGKMLPATFEIVVLIISRYL